MGFMEWALLIEIPIAVIVAIWFCFRWIEFCRDYIPRRHPKWLDKLFRK